eukprot:216947-Chlamydomonas_euryale.AAC.1
MEELRQNISCRSSIGAGRSESGLSARLAERAFGGWRDGPTVVEYGLQAAVGRSETAISAVLSSRNKKVPLRSSARRRLRVRTMQQPLLGAGQAAVCGQQSAAHVFGGATCNPQPAARRATAQPATRDLPRHSARCNSQPAT